MRIVLLAALFASGVGVGSRLPASAEKAHTSAAAADQALAALGDECSAVGEWQQLACPTFCGKTSVRACVPTPPAGSGSREISALMVGPRYQQSVSAVRDRECRKICDYPNDAG